MYIDANLIILREIIFPNVHMNMNRSGSKLVMEKEKILHVLCSTDIQTQT